MKHGVNNHKFSIVEECDFEELFNIERHWQERYNATSSNGLNCHLVNTDDKPKIQSEEVKYKSKTRCDRSKERNKIKNLSPFKVYGIISFRNDEAWKFLRKELTPHELSFADGLLLHSQPYTCNISTMPVNFSTGDLSKSIGFNRNTIKKVVRKLESLEVIKKHSITSDPDNSFYVFNPYIAFKDRYDIDSPMVRDSAVKLFSDSIYATM